MTTIGYVTKQDTGGYKGQLKTLSIQAEIEIVPNDDKSSPNQPDFRVFQAQRQGSCSEGPSDFYTLKMDNTKVKSDVRIYG